MNAIALPPDTVIKLAASNVERTAAVDFIRTAMHDRYGGEAPPTPGIIYTAWYEGIVVGAIALQGSIGEEPFPVERNYIFTEDHPFPCGRGFIGQASRWIATKSGVSLALAQVAMATAYQLGKRYLLVEAKPPAVQRLAHLGIFACEVSGASLNETHVCSVVGEAGMPYYRAQPLPKPYLIDLSSVAQLWR